jgi:SAM-dependent methyltransferase
MTKIKSKYSVSDQKFWDQCYSTNNIGWDLGKETPIFKEWCDKLVGKKNIFVPGCGNGYDPLYFASKFHNVIALDFSAEPIKRINKIAKEKNINVKGIKSDLFNINKKYYNKFDYVVEYTCFCAIDINKRSEYAKIVSKLLVKGGHLVAILFPINKNIKDGGPPYSVDLNNTLDMFKEYFDIIVSKKHNLSVKPRKKNEHFIVLKKR